MSEPIRKPKQTPESFSPKDKPEILNMMEKSKQNQQQTNLTENVLTGIPPMGYGDPSAVCYIGSVMRLMDYLNDPVDRNEIFTLSGAALCFPWKAGLCCDEISILPEIPQRTFAALGYESEYFYEPNIYIEPYSLTETREMINGQPKMTINPRKYTKDFYIERIKKSIDNGRPVIGFGLTELNFTCLITGYHKDGNGLNLRAYWSPQGEPEGYGGEDNYYYTEDWYDKCCGLVIVGEKTGERLKGEQAYRYVQETARILCEKKTEHTQGEVIYNNATAFDDMIGWLLNDDWWQDSFDTGNREMYLAPTGLLLLNYYRAHLRDGLRLIDKQCPGLVNNAVFDYIDRFEEKFQGAAQSRLNLYECVDPSITDISMLHNRAVRERVAAYVKNIKKMDQEIFDYLIGTEAK
ncbi:MAG: hypothetical protein PHV32_10880 [Eubacteriales bacterium]|nr:hypothetical protein [Eubacteriales bacterium]